MEVTEIQTKKQKVVIDVTCDSCGKSCKYYQGTIGNEIRVDNGEPYYSFEYMDLKVNWGYGSDHDCEEWTAHICQQCVDEKLSFINFQKRNYI